MPKELAALTARWQGVEKRIDAVWPDLASLIMQYRNQQSGAWPRLVTLWEMLEERLGELGATSARHPAAAGDAQVKKLVAEIDNVAGICVKLSKEYWQKKGTVFDELLTLQKDVEKAVKGKSGIFSRSQSLPLLKTLRGTVNTMVAEARFFTKDQPPKPDDPAIS